MGETDSAIIVSHLQQRLVNLGQWFSKGVPRNTGEPQGFLRYIIADERIFITKFKINFTYTYRVWA